MTQQPDYGASDRQRSLQRSFAAMRSALREIVFSHGDCSRLDEPRSDVPCDCPTCIARRALEGEEDWRFEGYKPDRRKSMPREAAMIDAWRHYFKHAAGPADGTTRPMDACLAKILFGERGGPGDVTERDWYVATTVVQWLATNVGQCVLFDAGYELADRLGQLKAPAQTTQQTVRGGVGRHDSPALDLATDDEHV